MTRAPIALGLTLFALACSEAPLPASKEWGRARTLLDDPASLAKAQLAMVSLSGADRDERPALRLALPGVLDWELDDAEGAERRLDLSLALLSEETASVRIQLTLDGEPQVALTLRPGAGWTAQSLALGTARRAALRASSEDGTPGEIAVAGLDLSTRGVARARSTPEQPNVVLVVVDTLRADRLGAYGHSAGTSPNLDALAHEGTLFEVAWAPCSWTLPSTVTLLTGLEPPAQPLFTHGFVWLESATHTLSEGMREHGMATAGFSCNSLVNRDASNVAQGFDEFKVQHGARFEGFVEDVEDWIEARGEERFFLYLHLFEPHRPLEPDADMLVHMGGVPIPPERMRAAALQQQRAERGLAYDAELLTEYFQERFRHYDAEVASVDRQLGRLLAHLESRGLTERTIVAVTSDHGEEFREHGLSGHAKQLYRESLQVPLLLRGPGIAKGARHTDPVSISALPRTLLRLAGGGPSTADLHGDLFGPTRLEPFFFSTQLGRWFGDDGGELLGPGPLYAVQSGGQKLFWYGLDEADPEAGQRAWVDLAQDPGETALANEGAARLGVALRAWLARCTQQLEGVSNAAAAREVMEALGYAGD